MSGRAPGGRETVLVIDDSDVDREVMLDLLRSAGLEAQGLPSPIGSTRVAREAGVRVAIIDQNLPAMDGSKLTGLFRSTRSLEHVRVVLVSGNDEHDMRAAAHAAGADAFVSKKNLQQELVPTTMRLLGQPRAQQRSG